MSNVLIVGSDKEPILDHLPQRNFLLIDDGRIIEKAERRARTFDISKHTISPLKDISYRTAQDFVSVLEAAFPGGANTLTRQNTSINVLEALLSRPRSLATLIKDTKDTHDAYQKIRRILLSPVLERVLNRGTNFSMSGTIFARLDPLEIGDFDAFFLGNLLISRYRGQVVVPDFGFYACSFHASLIRQDRLIAGVHFLDEAPELRNDLLLMETKLATRCTAKDAETLASYSGLVPGTNAYTDFIQKCVA